MIRRVVLAAACLLAVPLAAQPHVRIGAHVGLPTGVSLSVKTPGDVFLRTRVVGWAGVVPPFGRGVVEALVVGDVPLPNLPGTTLQLGAGAFAEGSDRPDLYVVDVGLSLALGLSRLVGDGLEAYAMLTPGHGSGERSWRVGVGGGLRIEL